MWSPPPPVIYLRYFLFPIALWQLMENLILSSDKTIYFSGTHCSLLYLILLHCTCNLLLICLFVYFQCSSVAQSCPTLCHPMNCSTPGLPVHHQLLEFTQTHVYQVGDATQPSHPVLSPSPPAPIPPSIRVFYNESTLPMRWPQYCSFSFSISSSNEHPGWSPLG